MLKIHFAVLMFGLTGLFGKFVSSPTITIVFCRCFFGLIFLYFCIKHFKLGFKFDTWRDFRLVILGGIIIGIHWFFFFQSIKVSTVSIGLISYATTAIFTAFIEPFYFKSRIRKLDVVLGCVTFTGVFMIVPQYSLSNNTTLGIILGLLAAFFGGLFSVICRDLVARYSSIKVAFFSYVTVAVLSFPMFVGSMSLITPADLLLLFILGTLFTGFVNTLFMSGFKKISASKGTIIIMLEPVYGIILAVLIFHEVLNSRMIIGAFIILACAFIATVDAQKTINKNERRSLTNEK